LKQQPQKTPGNRPFDIINDAKHKEKHAADQFFSSLLGAEHPETAKTFSDLSLLYFYEKKPAAAEEFARRALPLEEKNFGAESLQVSTTLNRLGISERDQGKFKEAEVDLKRALAIRETKQAPESWIAISLENLASVYEREGLEAKATPLITRARALHSRSSNN
jgi:tetratricopeptide (TPR) repeat protein